MLLRYGLDTTKSFSSASDLPNHSHIRAAGARRILQSLESASGKASQQYRPFS
jgi:hypothetical protein